MAATDFVTETQVDALVTAVATAVKNNETAAATADTNAGTAQTTADNHIADASAAHAASAISFADAAGDYTATDVEAALAEVRVVADAAAGGGVAINDSLTNLTDAWSSQKITDEIAAATTALIDSAPGALDTLNELAAAIGDDANFASNMTTALSFRVRVDAAQGFTGPQQDQGKSNLGIVSSVVDFAGDFNTAIA